MKNRIFEGKVAIVTGSGMGIGKAIALQFAQAGALVVLNDRERDKLHTTTQEFLEMGFEIIAVPADIRFPIQCKHLIRKAIERYGKIDILVNNAGLSSRGSVEEMATKNIKMLIDTNYTGTAYLSKYAIPHLRETQGHMIFINSVGGFRGMPYNSAYTASKAAQSALAEALRIELLDSGIHVGVAYVGYTENDPQKKILDTTGHWIYLPKRTNLPLASRESVAMHVVNMVRSRSAKITLTPLGNFTAFMTRYLPNLSDWLLKINREKINREFTSIGGQIIDADDRVGTVEKSILVDRKEEADVH